MAAHQLRVDNIANNLANVNTDGYKATRAEFEDLYYEKIRSSGGKTAAGTDRAEGIQVGHGTRTAALRRSFTQGGPRPTDRSLDVAIQGDGFFKVETADGRELYTRDGRFQLDSTGALVTRQGHTIGGITIPEGATVIEIARDGLVTAGVPGETPEEVGRLELSRFQNASGLEALGAGLYLATTASGEPSTGTPGREGFGETLGGYIEGSNVDIANELIGMIMAQRSYELTSKAITTADEMYQTTNNLVR
jgi:flagellar basal-body rod protein FlgG